MLAEKKKFSILLYFLFMGMIVCGQEQIKLSLQTEPMSRWRRIIYKVPVGFPEKIIVKCEYNVAGQEKWYPAAVRKYRSKTAENILALDKKSNPMVNELSSGRVTEHFAAGKTRFLIWQTFPQIPVNFKGRVSLKLSISDDQGKTLGTGGLSTELNNNGVVVLNDFSKLYPGLSDGTKPGWHYIRSFNKRIPGVLEAVEGEALLEPVVFRPKLKGYYAIFVAVPQHPVSCVELRLSSDFYSQRFDGYNGREYFWRIAKMDNEHLIIKQPAWTNNKKNDNYRARLNYVRLVPLSQKQYKKITRLERYEKDKRVFAYFEPYSWAFNEQVLTNEKFLEPLAAYYGAKVDLVDMQVGRHGAKVHYPSVVGSPLLGDTYGDATPGGKAPKSSGVAKLALLTNPIVAANKAGEAFDIPVSANFGAGISYNGSPLEGKFAKEHPEWIEEKNFLQFKYKEVRNHFLAMYEENLRMGAKIISLDFGRYPRVVDAPQYATLFLKELKALAKKYSTSQNEVKILVRFPVKEVRYERGNFSPDEWIKQRLVDYLVPSGVFPNMQYFDGQKYVKMTRGTGIKCLFDIDGGNGQHPWPGGLLRRIKQVYSWGADGIYIYQADARIVGTMNSGMKVENKKYISLFGRSAAVKKLLDEFDKENSKYSTDIYMFYPLKWQSYRMKVWIEGAEPETVELYYNGKLFNRYKGGRQLYIVGKEGYKNNYPTSSKPVIIKVRAKIKGKWLEKTFEIKAIHRSYS